MSPTKLKDKETLRMVGLMTGTSMDGLDICLADVTFSGNSVQCKMIDSTMIPITKQLQQDIRQALSSSTEIVTRVHYDLGRFLAARTERFLTETGIGDIDAVAMHGQTIHHVSGEATLQIGEPSFLSEVLGVPVVSDFRARDIAAGGTGAPLIPAVDKWLLQRETEAVVCLNLGGIANVTFLPAKNSDADVMGFDTGPAMSLLDEAASQLLNETFDSDGKKALSGEPNEESVAHWMTDGFIQAEPPKSTGRDYFGAHWLKKNLPDLNQWEIANLLASLSLFTARSVAVNCRQFLQMQNVKEIIVSGGGVHNRAVMQNLEKEFATISVVGSDSYGIDPDMKEAVGFAILGAAYLKEIPGNIPSVTGASRSVILGKMTI
ncbi:MAG: anhydro-N-acetylmuramic acid kinase [Candidatus Marinimicrobia bacterium]|nr:anhydro-N-acetylmuramic acid kinase [Candidatus Neomarinimicrobiota bacterium]MDP6568669.1 anhydro-N-acetylmuramic acid kinase [Candidatus Neomarinimicrobiota bacterium]